MLRRSAIVLLILGAVTAADAGGPTVAGGRLEFKLPDLQGRLVTSEDEQLSNKVVLVTVWATWCPPCLNEIPTLIELQDRYRAHGLVVVAIALERDGEERLEKLRRYCKDKGINYLVLDGGPPSAFAVALPTVDHVKGLPIEFLIDRSGRVVKARHSRGYSGRWAKRLEREITELLTDGGR
jgi:thiol-disulfide isomerase/thioredoxin